MSLWVSFYALVIFRWVFEWKLKISIDVLRLFIEL